MMLDHENEELIEDARLIDVFLCNVKWAEDVWTNCHCQVVCGHPVFWLPFDNLAEKLNVELERVEIEHGQLIEQKLDVEEHDPLYVNAISLQLRVLKACLPGRILRYFTNLLKLSVK